MDAQFWLNKWQRREIAFHRDDVNPFLARFLPELQLAEGQTIFLPLCGKTRDIAYLLSLGYHVVGVELSESAVMELFAELSIDATVTRVTKVNKEAEFTVYSAEGLRILVGDFFALQQEHLGPIAAVYDRAALVALPESMRQNYAPHLLEISQAAPQLLITYVYDQSQVQGPPFSVSEEEVRRHYGSGFSIEKRGEELVEGGMKGKVSSSECIYILRPV